MEVRGRMTQEAQGKLERPLGAVQQTPLPPPPGKDQPWDPGELPEIRDAGRQESSLGRSVERNSQRQLREQPGQRADVPFGRSRHVRGRQGDAGQALFLSPCPAPTLEPKNISSSFSQSPRERVLPRGRQGIC